ncbi:hypothetical protein HWV23_14325 [Natronomonas halophila]|uniref:hypothetical protein n=1 Tax=Natronomonas halophila TaxID=2747817 RepID=UPI0015B3D019|nr:hypothetical protein [Natronomonas halophila]QLD86849.1 hypothetical protein HWV23_14325 [Natronomonas halophila]
MSQSNDIEALRDRINEAADNSRFVRIIRRVESTLTRWTRNSHIVQWFLAEPDPEVIVIDLRETYTIGPIIRVLDWATDRSNQLAERTGLSAVAERTTRRIESEPLYLTGWFLFTCALGGLLASIVSGNLSGGWLLLSGIALLLTRERRSASELTETRIGRALIAAFEPPEPPEKDE